MSSMDHEKTLKAMDACVVHARDLLDSAKILQATGKHNIAYHLATLALEELGRRAIIGVESVSSKAPVPPAWPRKHALDHEWKLFWCFFSASFLSDATAKGALEDFRYLARHIHATRLVAPPAALLLLDRLEDPVPHLLPSGSPSAV
jgi:AbiV family abortive infection protein